MVAQGISIIDLTTKAGHYPDDMPITGEVRLWAMERMPRDWNETPRSPGA